jgi:putative transcriptional regulator
MKNSLKVQRAIHNMTQEDLANAVGVTRQTINAIEKGNYNPSLLIALQMAQTFKVKVEDIFQLEETD